MLTRTEAMNRIDRGVAKLNELVPDWLSVVNWDLLDMHNYDWCVLGQLFGEYSTGRDALEIECGFGFDYGFDLNGYEASPENWALLNELWQEVAKVAA